MRPWEKLWVTDWAIFRLESEAVKQSPPVSMVVLTVGQPKFATMTADVTVPAGKYSAYMCSTLAPMKPPFAANYLILRETRYYAPGVGVVKVEWESIAKSREKDVVLTKVLKKFVRAEEKK